MHTNNLERLPRIIFKNKKGTITKKKTFTTSNKKVKSNFFCVAEEINRQAEIKRLEYSNYKKRF